MSLPEILLWRALRQHPGGYLFRKQHPLDDFALDFACVRARLAIEVDGIAHEMGDNPARDLRRDAVIKSRGFVTLRIPAIEVLRTMDDVLTLIVAACRDRAAPRASRRQDMS